MGTDFTFFALLALTIAFGPWILIIALFKRTKSLRTDLEALRRTVRTLAERGKTAEGKASSSAGDVKAAEAPPAQQTTPSTDARPRTTKATEADRTALPAAQVAAPPPPHATEGLEQRLASRWLVWLGAITVALGSAFLIKHSFEAGWLSPGVRVTAGLGFAAFLITLGEWLRRQPLSQAIASMRPDYVPPALTGGGLFAAFASIYGAEALYGLMPPAIAFAGLAAVAFLGVGLSLLQGPFIALLGLVGGFVTPILIGSDDPTLWPLVAYLLALVGAGLLVVRYRGWPWLAYAVLAGAVLWALPLLALLKSTESGQSLAMAIYLLSTAALAILVLDLPSPTPAPDQSGSRHTRLAWRWLAEMGPVDRFRALSACLVAILAFGFARADGYGPVSLATLFIVTTGYLVAGRWRQLLTPLPIAALILVLATLSVWHIPDALLPWPEPLYRFEGQAYGTVPGPVLPPSITPFLMITAGFAALFGIGGFASLFGAWRPGLWAAISAAGPLLLLVVAYWRIEGFALSALWAGASLVLAALGVAAATIVGRYRHISGANLALGIYAAGSVAALSLAGVMVLEEAWLTVALSLQLPALAWLSRHLGLPSFRPVAAAVALVILVRLVLNPNVLDYALGSTPGFNWVLYGYGLPAVACYLASVWFRAGGVDRLITLLEANMLIFGVLLITLQIRALVAGNIAAPTYGLLEQSLQSIAWLMIALALMWTGNRRRAGPEAGTPPKSGLILTDTVLYWGWRILLSLSAVQVLVLQLVIDNPLWSPIAVGPWPIVNLLLLAYGLPAILVCLIAQAWPESRHGKLWSRVSYAIGLVLVMVYLSLELRHAFQGPRLDGPMTSNAEWYSYSALWLISAGALLGLGLWRANTQLRHAALIIVLITVGKVFLFDAAALTGLYRVASFFGLGLCLIGIGYLYQRFLASPSPQPVV